MIKCQKCIQDAAWIITYQEVVDETEIKRESLCQRHWSQIKGYDNDFSTFRLIEKKYLSDNHLDELSNLK